MLRHALVYLVMTPVYAPMAMARALARICAFATVMQPETCVNTN